MYSILYSIVYWPQLSHPAEDKHFVIDIIVINGMIVIMISSSMFIIIVIIISSSSSSIDSIDTINNSVLYCFLVPPRTSWSG